MSRRKEGSWRQWGLAAVAMISLLLVVKARPWCLTQMCGVSWGNATFMVTLLATSEPSAAIVVHSGGKPIPRAAVIVSRGARVQLDADGVGGETRVIPLPPKW